MNWTRSVMFFLCEKNYSDFYLLGWEGIYVLCGKKNRIILHKQGPEINI